MADLQREILARLAEGQNSDHAAFHKKYHKSRLKFYGWKTPELRRLASQALKSIPDRNLLLNLCQDLWREPVFETRMLANYLLAKRTGWLAKDDLDRFYEWFRRADGWALTDLLAIPVLGELLIRFPYLHDRVDEWRRDDWLWIRRAGILRFITPVRHKLSWPDQLDAILIFHFAEKDFFIRKAIGWTLREWGKIEPGRVRAFCKEHQADLSTLSYREAMKHLFQ